MTIQEMVQWMNHEMSVGNDDTDLQLVNESGHIRTHALVEWFVEAHPGTPADDIGGDPVWEAAAEVAHEWETRWEKTTQS
jgi:hypothetical protein